MRENLQGENKEWGSKAHGTPIVPEKQSHEPPSPVSRKGLWPSLSAPASQPPGITAGNGAGPPLGYATFLPQEPLCALCGSHQGQDRSSTLSPRDFGPGV